MIQKLIQHLITLLQKNFAGVIPNPTRHIVAGPIDPPGAGQFPKIALYPGKFAIGQNARETGSSQARPQEYRQELVVNPASPGGPYALDKTPLEKSTFCKIIYNRGEVTERQVLLAEKKDFTINYQTAAIEFSYDLTGASLIQLTYSFVGVFTVREFQQELLVDVYDNALADLEKFASLATSIILTNHDELLAHFNFTDKTEYTANDFLSSHTIDRIQFLAGTPDLVGTAKKLALTFQVTGQVKLTKQINGGFGLIEKIHSPGRISEQPVDIEIGVG